MRAEDCLQITNSIEPTPCFVQAGNSPCSLDYCPATLWLTLNPGQPTDVALHLYCVLSASYDNQTLFAEGKGVFNQIMGWG